MYPHPETCAKFEYLHGNLIQLQKVVTYNELLRPSMPDTNGEKCLIVIKNGLGTGFTLGYATGIESFVQEYKDFNIYSTSREITVYSYSHKDGAFSACGDSGSVVGDTNHGVVGMIIGGAGKTESTDVTYVSAYIFLDGAIKQAFPNSYLFQSAT